LGGVAMAGGTDIFLGIWADNLGVGVEITVFGCKSESLINQHVVCGVG